MNKFFLLKKKKGLKNICGPMIINLDLNQAIQQIFVFMLYQNSSSILKAVLLLYKLHSLMQVRQQ